MRLHPDVWALVRTLSRRLGMTPQQFVEISIVHMGRQMMLDSLQASLVPQDDDHPPAEPTTPPRQQKPTTPAHQQKNQLTHSLGDQLRKALDKRDE